MIDDIKRTDFIATCFDRRRGTVPQGLSRAGREAVRSRDAADEIPLSSRWSTVLNSADVCEVGSFRARRAGSGARMRRVRSDHGDSTGVRRRARRRAAPTTRSSHSRTAAISRSLRPTPRNRQRRCRNRWRSLAKPTLMHWAVRCSGTAALAKRLRELGWSPTEVRACRARRRTRRRSSGSCSV